MTGISGQQLGTKTAYFNTIREWNKKGNTIATGVEVLNENEKSYSGGYDAIICYWVKVFTKKTKKKILKLVRGSS